MPRPFAAHLLRRTTWVVMLALVVTQALGLVHRVVHAPHAAPMSHWAQALPDAAPLPSATVPSVGYDNASGGAAASPCWLDRLFGAHDGGACDAYDQLAHADLLWGAPAELCTLAVKVAAPACNPAWQLAAQASGYLARGPPLLA